MLNANLDSTLHAVYQDLQRRKKNSAKRTITAHELYDAAWAVIFNEIQVHYVVQRAERIYNHFGLRILPWQSDIMQKLYETCRTHYDAQKSCEDALEPDELAHNLAYALTSITWYQKHMADAEQAITIESTQAWLDSIVHVPPPKSNNQIGLFG